MKVKSRRYGVLGIILICVLTVAALTACSQPQESSPAPEEEKSTSEVTFIRVGTASLGGNFFPMGAAVAQAIGATIPNVNATAQATGGSAFNVGAIQRGELEMALSQSSAVASALRGEGTYEGIDVSKVMTLCNYNPTPQHILVQKDLDVKSLQDLKGKKIEVVAIGDGLEVNTKQLLDAVGIGWDDFKPVYDGTKVEAASALKTRQVDAVIDGTGIGSSWIVDVVGDGDLKLLSLSDEERGMIISKYPEYGNALIPAGSYRGQDEDVKAVANATVILVSADLSEELVYNITKQLFENQQYLVNQHSFFEWFGPEYALEGLVAPLHPGSEKYFKEIGIL